jgi:hypothetical protein
MKRINVRQTSILALLLILFTIAAHGAIRQTQDDEPKLTLYQEESTQKWGFKDEQGNVVIPCKYDKAWDFMIEGLAIVQSTSKLGFIDKTGKEITPCIYSNISVSTTTSYGVTTRQSFFEGLTGVQLNGKWGFIDMAGQMVIPCQYDAAFKFTDGLAQVRLNGKWGFVNKTGEVVVPCIYDAVFPFSEGGTATVRLGQKEFKIDKTGKEL